MSDVTKGKVNYGYFDGSCDKIQWNNTFDRSHWCRRSPPGTPAGTCLSPPPPPAPPPPQAAGEYAFLELKEITAAAQELDLMTGSVISNWSYAGEHDVQVVTLTDADTDTVSTRFTAPAAMGLTVQLAFCNLASNGAACTWTPFGDPNGPLDEHYTTVVKNTHAADGKSGRLDVGRRLGLHDTYSTSCTYNVVTDVDDQAYDNDSNGIGGGGSASFEWTQTSAHSFALAMHGGGSSSSSSLSGSPIAMRTVEVSCRFELNCCIGSTPPKPDGSLAATAVPSFAESSSNSAANWESFWMDGAFVDMASHTSDPRAAELERRTILSQYVLKAQETGSVPPQESALLYNSWTGKHHNEMRYWHQTWLPVWGHPELLARSDQWFIDRASNATTHTAHQGYKGIRWGKMLGEANIHGVGAGDGTKPIMYWESPNNINPGLVWHQPHVVYMSELEYRASKTDAAKQEVLHRMKGVVLGTAAFIADFPERRIGTGTNGKWLDLGPPLVSASEGEGPFDVWNPTYELTQFNFSLDIANTWLERLGQPRNVEWDDVRKNLAPLPVVTLSNSSGTRVYNRHQHCLPNVFSHGKHEHCSGPNSHPALTGALGCLPGDKYGVDREVMNNTLYATLANWEWSHCWGWDQPMVAMTAVRLEQPEVAVDTLLMNVSTNVYLPTGYNHPTPDGLLAAYLPGNGGTLIAVGLMAGGWEGAPDGEAPGFPADWKVQAEGFTPYF